MHWLSKIFSGGVDAGRVNPAGLTLMAAALAIAFMSGLIAGKCPGLSQNTIKIISLVICAGGALLAILG